MKRAVKCGDWAGFDGGRLTAVGQRVSCRAGFRGA